MVQGGSRMMRRNRHSHRWWPIRISLPSLEEALELFSFHLIFRVNGQPVSVGVGRFECMWNGRNVYAFIKAKMLIKWTEEREEIIEERPMHWHCPLIRWARNRGTGRFGSLSEVQEYLCQCASDMTSITFPGATSMNWLKPSWIKASFDTISSGKKKNYVENGRLRCIY